MDKPAHFLRHGPLDPHLLEEDEHAVEDELDDVGGRGQLLDLPDVRRLDAADRRLGFVHIPESASQS
jgi:hypothetical protein